MPPLQPGSCTGINENCYIPLTISSGRFEICFRKGDRLMNRKPKWIINHYYLYIYLFIFIHKNLSSLGTLCKIIGWRNNKKLSNRVLLSPENTVLHRHKRSQKYIRTAEGKKGCINSYHITTVVHKKGRAWPLNSSFQLTQRNLKFSLLESHCLGARIAITVNNDKRRNYFKLLLK